jgi:iron complex transport system permease protein
MGSFAASSWKNVQILTAASVVSLAVAIFYSRDLNIMTMGNRVAGTLGVNPASTRKILLITCSMATAISVSVSGIIGFVGLIVPHLLRIITGPDNRVVIPLSFIGGAILLLGADTITRAVLPSEVPIGVLTALIGGPFFCMIFKKGRKEGGS